MQGSLAIPLRLPSYPTNKLILLELTRQLVAFDTIVKDLHKKRLGAEFPLRIEVLEAFPFIQSAYYLEKEMMHFNLYSLTNLNNFDPYGIAKKQESREYRHKIHIEDYWANTRSTISLIRWMIMMTISYSTMKISYSTMTMKNKRINHFLLLIGLRRK